VAPHGAVKKVIRGVPILGRKNIFFSIDLPRVECKECKVIRQIDPGISEPNKRYTKAFVKAALICVRSMSIQAAAAHLGVDWHTINDIFQGYLKKKYDSKMFKNVTRIGIDETYMGKRHKFLTIVLDLDTGDPIFVGLGKGEDALKPFWKALGRRKNKIEAVAIDMSAAYQKAVRENVPNADAVFDHFHVVKMMNERIDQLRRAVFNSASAKDKQVLRGCRYLLLKNVENLSEKNNERERLDKVLELNTPLTTAYILKESLKQIWLQNTYEEGRACLMDWTGQALASGVGALMRLGFTIQKHAEGILNYYRHRITTSHLESFNCNFKVLLRRGRGYRNMGNLMRTVLAIREFKPSKLYG
jgi:transposase